MIEVETIDLRHEEARKYHYRDGHVVEIEMPARLIITETGEHRIVDVANVGIVVAPGWDRIDVYPRFGRAPFGGTAATCDLYPA